jgi:hypothetical protein
MFVNQTGTSHLVVWQVTNNFEKKANVAIFMNKQTNKYNCGYIHEKEWFEQYLLVGWTPPI